MHAGFVKLAEVAHDASIYKMYESEAAQIQVARGQVHRVVLDFEFKKQIYSDLNEAGDYADLSYARRHGDLTKLHELPVVDSKVTLPDLRIEYETADGERAHVDLELATENYRPAHMSQKLRGGFNIYDVNSTSRGRRAEWEGRELTAQVVAQCTTLMTRDERIANVQRLGYAQAEAESPSLVALHGGYFVRRQFDVWIGAERGKRSEEFLADLLGRGHCRRDVFAHNREVFHALLRPLYRAVEDENSRNRRDHQPRLMTLDFVLAHPDKLCFATEREKFAHVCDECGIDHEALPSKAFCGAEGSALTRRCFLDRFPLFTRPGAEELAFCYVDSRFETSGSFATHLGRYLPLFAEFPSFELVCVTTASTRLGQAQTVFERVLSRGRKRLKKVTDPDRLLARLRDRKRLRNGKPAASIGSGSMGCATTSTVFLGDVLPGCSRAGRPPATKRFWRKSPRRRCPTHAFLPSFCLTTMTCLDAWSRCHELALQPHFGERSKKGPFTSVSMEAFTKDRLQSPSRRAARLVPGRIDPVFGVTGGAGAHRFRSTAPPRTLLPSLCSVMGHSRPSPCNSHVLPRCELHRQLPAKDKGVSRSRPVSDSPRVLLRLIEELHTPKTLAAAEGRSWFHFRQNTQETTLEMGR